MANGSLHFHCFLIFVFALCVLKISLGQATKQKEFDYFLLSFQWPATLCQDVHVCCESNACCRRKDLLYFTIHGLWPNSNDGNHPSFCPGGEPFDKKKVKNSLEKLERDWPSLICGKISGKEAFWGHEWDKHGTCAAPNIVGVSNYFTKVLNLYETYDVTNLLNTNGIHASDTKKYSSKHVESIIDIKFGATPNLLCTKQQKLKEIQICFTKKFKPRDCVKLDETKACQVEFSIPPYHRVPSYHQS